MGKKRLTSMRLDEELIEKAHDLGLNTTKVCENALKDMIRRIEGSNSVNNSENSPKDEGWWDRPDLNRGPERPRLRA